MGRQRLAQPAPVDQDPVGVGRAHRQSVRREQVGQRAAEPGHARAPAGEVGGRQQLGQRRCGQAAHRPLRLAGAAASDEVRVGQHVAEAEAGAGQQLRQRPDHHGRAVPPRPSAGGQGEEGLVPDVRPLVGSGQEAARAVRVRAPQRSAPARVQPELGLVDAPADLGGDQCDGLGAAVGQEQPARLDTDRPGQRLRGGVRVRVGPCRGQVAGQHGRRVRCQRVQREREIEHRAGLQPERTGHGLPVATVRARGRQGHRAAHHRAHPISASAPASAAVTSPESRTAAPMSSTPGGRPAPRAGRSSVRSP